jgi:Fungal specific transcription factor domain
MVDTLPHTTSLATPYGTSQIKSSDGRLAVSVGMHRASNVTRHDDVALSFIEIQERKRVFWGMYFLDSCLSILLGRPPLIRDSDIDLDLPESKPDSKITSDGLLPDDMDEQPEIFIYEPLRSLYVILRKLALELYGPAVSKDRGLTDLSNTIGSVGGELATWRLSVPPGQTPFGTGEIPETFANALPLQLVFSLAYYWGQCMLYRPALVEATHRSAGGHEGGSQRRQTAGRGVIKQYINPQQAAQPDPWSEDMEGFTGRSAHAARDLLHLVHRGRFTMATQQQYVTISTREG